MEVLDRKNQFIIYRYDINLNSHGIVARKADEIDGRQIERSDRISLTFRTIRTSGKCIESFLREKISNNFFNN